MEITKRGMVTVEEVSAKTGVATDEIMKACDAGFKKKWDKMINSDPDSVFAKISKIEDISALSKEEREKYDYAIKKYRDTLAVESYEWTQGFLEGYLEGYEGEVRRIAKELAEKGYGVDLISKCTGLTEEEIEGL